MKRSTMIKNQIITDTLIEEHCNWLHSCEKSMDTIQRYKYYLQQFNQYMSGKCVTKKDVIIWKGILREKWAPVTVNGALAALNGFFSYYKWLDCKTKYFKITHNVFCPEDRELTKDEYKRLVKTAHDKGNERMSLLLQTICSTGIRVSELSYITVEAAYNGKAEVECKGRIRTVFMTKQLCLLLKKYAEKHHIISGMIFVTRNGKALDRSNIWRDMKKISEAAKVMSKKVFPHNLRHLFARSYYDQEKDLSRLADILGHSSVNTTRIYTMESGYNHMRQLEKLKLLFDFDNRIPLLL